MTIHSELICSYCQNPEVSRGWTPLLVYVELFVDSGVHRLLQGFPASHPAP